MVLVPKHAVKANGRCLHHGILVPKTHGEGLAAADKSRNALGLPPQAMALALAMGRKPMPPTRPHKSIMRPLFFHRAARDLFCGHSPCYGGFWGIRGRHLGGMWRAS